MPFIVLEGLDGAGKSTQLKLLKDYLLESGFGYEYLHFPRFDSPVYGDLIARYLRGELGSIDQVDPYVVALLFAGDRADAAGMIKGWLAEGTCVITDRYVYSNIAYQCAKIPTEQGRKKLAQWIIDLEYGYNKIPSPDISVFLDVPFDFTRDRLAEQRAGDDREYLRGGKDIHEESLDLQQMVRKVYAEYSASDSKLHMVDCSDGNGGMDTPANNFSKIRSLIDPFLNQK